MKRMALVMVVVLMLGSVASAQAPSSNGNSLWVTVCSWDTNPACLVYHVVNGIWKLWK